MADKTEKILLQVELDVNQLTANAQKAAEQIALLTGRQKDLKKTLDDMRSTGDTTSATFNNLSKEYVNNQAKVTLLKNEYSNYQKQLVLVQQQEQEQTGSLQQLRVQLAGMTAQYDAMTESQRENTEEGKQLGKSIDELVDKLKEQEDQTGRNQRSVGNYAEGFKTFRQEIKQATDELKANIDKFGEQSKQADESKQKLSDLKDRQKDLNREIEAFQPEGKFAAFSKVASGVAGGFAAAQGAAALFGGENDKVNETLLKVQSTMAIFQGLKAFSELGKDIKILIPILGLQTAQTKAAAVANTELGVAEGEAAVGAEAVGVATKAALGPIGLIVAGVTAAIVLFSVLGASGKASSESIEQASKSENEAHRLTLASIKEKHDALVTDAEDALNAAQAQKKSATDILQLQQKLLEARRAQRNAEKGENELHIDALLDQQKKLDIQLATQSDIEERKKLDDQKQAKGEEILQLQLRNAEVANENSKSETELAIIQAQGEQKRKEQANQLASLRIATIRDDGQRELAAIRQNAKAQLDAILDTEVDAAGKKAAIKLKEEEDIAKAVASQNLKLIQTQNATNIALTKEGSLARIAAEIAATKSEGEALLQTVVGNSRQAEAERLRIQAETNQKLGQLDQQRLQFIDSQHQIEIDLYNRKQQAILKIQESEAGDNIEQQLAARLNAVTVNLQAEIQAKENAAEKEKEIAFNTITDQEELNQRLIEIDDALYTEEFAALVKSKEDIKAATDQYNADRIQGIIDQKQLELDAADPQEEFDKRIELLAAQEQAELSSAQKRLGLTDAYRSQKELIEKKYDNIRKKAEEEKDKQTVAGVSSTLAATSSLFKKGTQEYRIFASAQALIDTYAAAVSAYKAVAGIPIVGPALGVVAAAGAIKLGKDNIEKINSAEFYEGGFSTEGGHTGDASPRSVSTAVGRKPYTYHAREYIIDHSTLMHPVVSNMVANVIEPMRQRRYSYSIPGQYDTGGFSQVPTTGGSAPTVDLDQVRAIIVDTVTTVMAAQPRPVVFVEDINVGQKRVADIQSGANW